MARYLFAGGPADVVVQAPTSDQIYRFAPGATVTVWDSHTGGAQITDLLTENTDEPLGALVATSAGRIPRFRGPDGYTQLWLESGGFDRYVITSTDVGSLVAGKLDRDEVPPSVTALAAQVSSLGRGVGGGISYAYLNTDTNTWPARPDTPGPVVWIGDAVRPGPDLAHWGLDYVDQLAAVGGSTNVPDPTPAPTPTPDPVTGIALSAPVASINGSQVSFTANLTTTGGPVTFAFAQLAVRGPSGQTGYDTAFNSAVIVDGVLALSGTITASIAGTWHVFATYNLTGGADQMSWVDGPSTAFVVSVPTPATPTPGGVPMVAGRSGGSGLLWNSGTFHGGNNVATAQTFGTWRGRPIDAFLTFNDRSSWNGMFSIDSTWAAFTGVIVNSTPPQPVDQNNSGTAAGTNNQRWIDYGSKLAAAGLNRNTYILRVWEVNGDWYPWAMGGGRNSVASFVAAIKNMSTSVKSTAPNIKISINFNRGNPFGASWQSVIDQLKGNGPSGRYIDVIGLDTYDWYPGQSNSSGWNNALNQNPGLASVSSYCRANGLQMSLEEWALIDSSGGSSGGGAGDDPYYITQMWSWYVANKDIIAYEGYYDDDGAPATLLHKMTTGRYPNAAAAYRSSSRWGNL